MGSAETHGSKGRLSKLLQAVIGLAVSVICVYLLVKRISIRDAVQKLSLIDWRFVALAIASLGAGYALRVYRWAIMLRAYKPEVAFRSCAAPYLGSIALNNLLPFRAGDVVRALVFPNSLGVSKTDSTISLVIERIIDVLVLIVFFIISMIVSGTRYFPATIVKGSIILGTMLIPFMILLILFSSRIANSLKKRREKTAEGTYRRKVLDAFYRIWESVGSVLKPSIVGRVFVLSLGLWLFETGLYFSLILGFGWPHMGSTALSIMSVGTLSTLVPSSPGYIGTFDFVVFTFLTFLGIDKGSAGSYSILCHLMMWLPTSVVGLLFIAFNPKIFKIGKTVPKEGTSNA